MLIPPFSPATPKRHIQSIRLWTIKISPASNNAIDQSLRTPEAAKWSAFTLEPNAHFKVLDIYKIDDQVQIFLLHFREEHLEAFKGVKTNLEAKIIEKARESFDKKVDAEFNYILESEQWVSITEFPIGMDDNGNFIPVRAINEALLNRLMKGDDNAAN